jgi:hypothetical protein
MKKRYIIPATSKVVIRNSQFLCLSSGDQQFDESGDQGSVETQDDDAIHSAMGRSGNWFDE